MKKLRFREANLNDLNQIMEIIYDAQQYLKSQDIDQWQNGYPNSETIKDDIKARNSYVMTYQGKVIAYTALIFGEDETYINIYDGQWLNNNKYAVIHRMAVAKDHKGNEVAVKVLEAAEKLCKMKNVSSIRIDTHEDNISMQRLIEKYDFDYCGIIFTSDDAKRLAYQKDF